jgi:hypothetical protein
MRHGQTSSPYIAHPSRVQPPSQDNARTTRDCAPDAGCVRPVETTVRGISSEMRRRTSAVSWAGRELDIQLFLRIARESLRSPDCRSIAVSPGKVTSVAWHLALTGQSSRGMPGQVYSTSIANICLTPLSVRMVCGRWDSSSLCAAAVRQTRRRSIRASMIFYHATPDNLSFALSSPMVN